MEMANGTHPDGILGRGTHSTKVRSWECVFMYEEQQRMLAQRDYIVYFQESQVWSCSSWKIMLKTLTFIAVAIIGKQESEMII